MVLRRLRRADLWRTRGAAGLDEPPRRHAGRYDVALSRRALLSQERASLGSAGRGRRMPRDRAVEFHAAGGEMARAVAGVFRAEMMLFLSPLPACGERSP